MTETDATEVREALDGFDTELVAPAVEEFIRCVVEEGTFAPEGASLNMVRSHTWRERITGRSKVDVKAVFLVGLLLGCALERDAPAGTELEERWRAGEFELPD